MMRGRRGGMRRWQELARLAMAIAIKEENVQRETSKHMSEMSGETGDAQSTNDERRRVSLEVRDLFP